MDKDNERIIFHIDVNSAFLSWTAADRLKKGESVDLREIPSVVGGDQESRRGVVLAKSTPAKPYGVQTGESLFSAKRKCPQLVVVPPDFKLYQKCSSEMMNMLRGYTPVVEQYSIDECFMDMAGLSKEDSVGKAFEIKERIKEELGFTVNVGISTNKLLAKMASELKKPDMIHTLYMSEIKNKMWPLPVGDLFMVGKSSADKLNRLGIYTIGDLARYNPQLLKEKLKSHGALIWMYANGIDNSEVSGDEAEAKVISSSSTFAEDITDRQEAYKALLYLVDNTAMRLRQAERFCSSVSVSIRNSSFKNYSHQRKLNSPTDSTRIIAETAKELFDEIWKKEPVRLLGVALSQLSREEYHQISLFKDKNDDNEKNKAIDKILDNIKEKYGTNAITRSVFLPHIPKISNKNENTDNK